MEIIRHHGFPNKRKQGDLLLNLLSFLGAASIIIVASSLYLLIRAKKDTFAIMDGHGKFQIAWENYSTRYLFALLITGFLLSIAGLVINSKRLKRKFDYVRLNILFLFLFSAVGIVIYLIP